MEWLREPAVAGRFYPGRAADLEAEVGGYLSNPISAPREATMVVGPHAGYLYSGAVAGAVYAAAVVPSRAVVLCPNHTGAGARRALWPRGSWRMPMGDIPVDEELCTAALERAGLTVDRLAHLGEHSLEVHLPFLQARRRDVRIVPICLGRLSVSECEEVGLGLARAVRDVARDTILVASTDMSHYVSAEEAKRLDGAALDRILALDPAGLHRTVEEREISMCGYVPTTVGLFACRELGASGAELIRYGSSGEASGDFTRVVGYAGVIVS